MLPSSASESMSLFGTPAYPPIAEGISASAHERTSNKEVSQTRVKSSDAYDYNEVDEVDGGERTAHDGEDYRWYVFVSI